MTARHTFQLLAALNSDHEQLGTDDDSPPRVIPIVHDSFNRDRQVLREAFRRLDGELFEVRSNELRKAGPSDQALFEAARSACEQRPELDIALSQEDGELIASTSQDLHGNDSQALVMATLVLLLSDELVEQDLVGIVYDSSVLDEPRAAFLWHLTVDLLPPRLPTRLRTFVPIAMGNVDYPRQCVGDPSLRYAIVRESLRKRYLDESNLQAKLGRIAPKLETPLVVFLAAGASASARIPVGDVLRDEAIARLLGKELGDPQLLASFRRWLAERDAFIDGEDLLTSEQFATGLTLERVLREEFLMLIGDGKSRSDSDTVKEIRRYCEQAIQREPDGRKALQRVLELHPRVVAVTVNFDWQIENDLGTAHDVYASNAEFANAVHHVRARIDGTSPSVPILKIHGTIDRSETLVADVGSVELGLQENVRLALQEMIDAARDQEAQPLNWVWIGCSMRDVDVNSWSMGIGGGRVNDWWVDPLHPPTLEDYVRRVNEREAQTFNLGDRLVSELADTFLVALATRVERQAASTS